MKRKFNLRSAVTVAVCSLGLMAPGAQAATPSPISSQTIVIAALSGIAPCRYVTHSEDRFDPQLRVAKRHSRQERAAILGGGTSALERMRMQQAIEPAAARASEPALAPGINRILGGSLRYDCGGQAVHQPAAFVSRGSGGSALLGPNDFLASKRLQIRRTSFDQAWARVRRPAISSGEARALVGAGTARPDMETLGLVNAWANRNIRYVEDRELYGKSDHWAEVRATLSRRAGDCEDIAIAKMQVLAALGISRNAMHLTVVRDLVRNADHALLVVKISGRHWVLDNATDRLLDGTQSHDYRPIMSFGAGGAWLHGYPQA